MPTVLLKALSSLLLLSALLFAGATAAALPAAVDGQPLPTLAPVIEKVMPSVVNVHTRTRVQVRSSPFFDDPFFRRFFDLEPAPRERIQQSLGSGVIVDAAGGHVLTNNHVIENADDIAVRLSDGREFSARLVGADPDTDLAVIRIAAEELSALPLDASDDLRVGDFVVAVGNPFGLGQTVTSGIVSALGRGGLRGLEFQNFIQTDASINPGNSGGALINLRGELVGINTAIFTPSGGNVGIGFAIPASTAAHVMAQLIEHGEVRRVSFGADVQDLDAELGAALKLQVEQGAVITRLAPDSVLRQAGLQAGDVIVRLDGRPVEGERGLHLMESQLAVGSQVELEYARGGKTRSVQVQLAENLDERISGGRLDARLEGAALARIPASSRSRGVLVETVRRGTPAWKAGLRPGDLIVAFEGRQVEDLTGLRGYFPQPEGMLRLNIRRRGQLYRVDVGP